MPIHFGKRTLFLVTNAVIGLSVGIYLLLWLVVAVRTVATITKPYAPQLQVQYKAGDKLYQALHMRNNVDFGNTRVTILYLPGQPQTSRVFSLMGFMAEPLGWWAVYLTASAMLLLTNNTVFSKGTRFTLHKRFPYISMDEFFPAAKYNSQQETSGQAQKQYAVKIKRLRRN